MAPSPMSCLVVVRFILIRPVRDIVQGKVPVMPILNHAIWPTNPRFEIMWGAENRYHVGRRERRSGRATRFDILWGAEIRHHAGRRDSTSVGRRALLSWGAARFHIMWGAEIRHHGGAPRFDIMWGPDTQHHMQSYETPRFDIMWGAQIRRHMGLDII